MPCARRRAWHGVVLCSALLVTAVDDASAQDGLPERCANAAVSQSTSSYCRLVAQAADILPSRVAIVAAGGNPVPGEASTLGIRLGAFPRFSVNGRYSLVWLPLPPILRQGEDVDMIAHSWNADASIGLYSGASPFATVGGVGAVDLLGSVGIARLPDDDGANDDAPITWGLGARLGITRESFTFPGISLSAMYRKLGEVTYGDGRLQDQDAFVHVDELSLWSARAVVGKRITVLGFVAGLGWDRYSGHALIRVRDDAGGTLQLRDDSFDGDRWNLFANASWTMLIISATAEVGWQSGGDAPAGSSSNAIELGAVFGSLAIRLAF